ncbi:MAG: hypothetical protein EOO81_01120 [Oxalobacteraceae bacterium]|nr:MAG: hypothetical protein EOO81_01120 [Oxalobacteraceae bacterium]
MLITNHSFPIELILTLCSPTGVTEEDTKDFFTQNDISSHDWIVKEWTRKVELVLDLFSRYGHDVTPLQGLNDNGVDVLLQTENEADCTIRVGFQLKSNREANNSAKQKSIDGELSLTRTMKRQAMEAQQYHQVDEWWFVQCFDYVAHKNLVHINHAALPPGTKKNFTIRHIGPRSAYAFLSRSDEQTIAICLLFLSPHDEVVRKARLELEKLLPRARSIVEYTIFSALDQHPVMRLNTRDLSGLFDVSIDESDDNLEEESDVGLVADALEHASYLERNQDDDDSFLVRPTVYPALCALFFDARVRYEKSGISAGSFVLSLLNAKMPKIEYEFE